MCSVRRVGSGRKVPRNSFIKVIKETKKGNIVQLSKIDCNEYCPLAFTDV